MLLHNSSAMPVFVAFIPSKPTNDVKNSVKHKASGKNNKENKKGNTLAISCKTDIVFIK